MGASGDTTESAKRICAAIRAIPAGTVAGYGEVARRAGLPGRARMVARLLAAAGEGELPWHRVVRSDGRIAFAAGSEGFIEQSTRLREEGVAIVDGRVVGMRRPQRSLDETIWGP